ncbi:PilZ domain-containing protein [Legionella worsleiensis]|uniref:Type IV pilus assembly PilZ n=1 Tax=Legionella worsleiensis TaxID=45076 RepID=A0A0W1A696_9GAMM|nr:PilZ domain-containing protein [Legionella worsleiensis]KTD76822.1 type IV pilus assembly PilZ [Legionella worsleiensis]STY30686.1 type IV pilus assembly PilZ [Legionella worsleiensis]
MPVNERRQHFRIDDQIYFDYRVISPGELCTDSSISNQLLGENGQKYMEAMNYFQHIDHQLSELTQALSSKESAIADCLNLLNAKIDYLSRHVLMSGKLQMKKVNISLGGMSFKTSKLLEENTHLKIVLYTKPRMIPVILDAFVVYSQFQNETNYRTAVAFTQLTIEQEQLLSQHILQAQVKNQFD